MKKFLYFICLCGIMSGFSACQKKEEIKLCTLYGIVTDITTGEPVKSAGVELQPKGKKVITGSDGSFEFVDLEDGTYKLQITKSGYKDYTSNDIVVNAKTQNVSHSIQIEKLPPSLSVLDDQGNDVSSLDFGDNQEIVMRSFFIFNNGEEKLEWNIVYSCVWIDTISKQSGELKSNASQPIVVTIDRNKLNVGNDTASINVISNSGTREIMVTAAFNVTLETLAPAEIRSASVMLSGKVSQNLSPSISEYGFVYSKKDDPTLQNGASRMNIIGRPPVGSAFNALVSDLESSTTYYARAYVTNGQRTLYGEQVSFQTTDGRAVVTTDSVSVVTATGFTVYGTVVTDCDIPVTARGFCYAATQYPTVENNNYTTAGKDLGVFHSKMAGLEYGKTYYVRAYATNATETVYGKQLSVTTKSGLPVVKTAPVTNIGSVSATCGGEVIDDGTLTVTARGICYGTRQQPTIEGTHTTDGIGKGSFTSKMLNLKDKTTYYVRAYATTAAGTAYGEELHFSTTDGMPVVVLKTIGDPTANSVTCKGDVTGDGGVDVTERGFCYALTQYPTNTDHHVAIGSGLGEFNGSLTGLAVNTTYYVRSYAVNSIGVGYSEQQSFTTKNGLATVTTGQASSTATSITAAGNVTANGGYVVTARGICYSAVNSEPTLTDQFVESGTGNGEFRASVTGLSASTTYYLRAYATNANGTAYGAVVTVVTKDGNASVSIGDVANITALTASGTVTVTDAGSATLQSCGICWSTNPNPTVSDSKVAAPGKQLNSAYRCNLTELQPNTKYYVRGYATTDIATAYSTQHTFQTATGLPVIATNKTTATSTAISSGGTITSDGGYAITIRGVCYSTTNAEPNISDAYMSNGTGIGSFTSVITNVSLNTTYYVRAFASNSIGISYGSVETVITGNGLPTVTTTVIGENVTETTAFGGGNVIDDGGYAVTARGVCWNTLPNPTINDNKTIDGSGNGYFTSNITGIDLTGNDIYYVRAYATNANGTVYGQTIKVSKENFEYANLPTIKYAGYTYKLYYDMGIMTWDNAVLACEALSFGGYDDWYLPIVDELQACYLATKNIEGWKTNVVNNQAPYYIEVKGQYWTSEEYGSWGAVTFNIVRRQNSGEQQQTYTETDHFSRDSSQRVRAVRKYVANQ